MTQEIIDLVEQAKNVHKPLYCFIIPINKMVGLLYFNIVKNKMLLIDYCQ